MIPLPEDFIKRMQPALGAEWDAFLDTYRQPKAYGLRANPLKKDFTLPFTLQPVPWAPEGFYADPEEHPGRHPLHEAGAFYIQEPSAMSVVSLLDPQPGENICDLCAAPGGKSTQIAGRLQGQGFLVSNEIFPARARILSQNLERLGVFHALVCNEPTDRLADHFPLFFDRIVIDAPCSGEGMFRKDAQAISEWSPKNVALCADRQKMILENGDRMLQPGGVLVYSTCTFAPQEDEEIVAWFLSTHPDYTLEDWKQTALGQLTQNQPAHAGLCDGSIPGTLRLWPHKLNGEGHFAARFRKKGTSLPTRITDNSSLISPSGKKGGKKKKQAAKGNASTQLSDAIRDFQAFREDFLQETSSPVSQLLRTGSRFELFGEELYLVPSQAPSLQGLKLCRAGLHLGTLKKNRFEPAHALAKALSLQDVRQVCTCSLDDAKRYLHGETIACENTSYKGWTLVAYDHCPLGWGKAQNGLLKNHYPKGLRQL